MFLDGFLPAIPFVLPNAPRVDQGSAAQKPCGDIFGCKKFLNHNVCVDCTSVFQIAFVSFFIINVPDDVINESKCFD